jgi:hypothetical protein
MNRNHADFNWTTVGLDFGNWEEEKLWAIELPVTALAFDELTWLLDVPFWTNDRGDRWTVTPREALARVPGTDQEYERTLRADTSYPIDIFCNHGKWLVLDGLHRLTLLAIHGATEVRVRVVPRDRLPEIASEYPIELPSA